MNSKKNTYVATSWIKSNMFNKNTIASRTLESNEKTKKMSHRNEAPVEKASRKKLQFQQKKKNDAKLEATTCYKTFPRMSPSKKIENINIVLPPRPAPEISQERKQIFKQIERINQFIKETIRDYNEVEVSVARGTSPSKSNDFKVAKSTVLKVPKVRKLETPRAKPSDTSRGSTSTKSRESSSSTKNAERTTATSNTSILKDLSMKQTHQSSTSPLHVHFTTNPETSPLTCPESQKIPKRNGASRIMNNSLVKSMIQKLKSACKKTVKSSFHESLRPKGHVKRLIQLFERGQDHGPKEQERQEEERGDSSENSKQEQVMNYSIVETRSRSRFSSTSTIYKDLEGSCSSDFERQLSPILREAQLRSSSPQTGDHEKEQEDRICWWPIPKYDKLDSSFLLSTLSRLSLDRSSRSICDGRRSSCRLYSDASFRTIYAKGNASKQLLFDERIVDSGYSDRQSTCSTTSDESYEGREGTRTPSDVDPEYELLYHVGKFTRLRRLACKRPSDRSILSR